MSNDERCNDCGAEEGELHHPECHRSLAGKISAGPVFSTVNSAGITFSEPGKVFLVVVNDDYGDEIASIEVDRESRQLRFHGDLDEGSKQFAKYVNAHLQSLFDGDRDGLRDEPVLRDPARYIQDHVHDGGSYFRDVGLRREDKFGRY